MKHTGVVQWQVFSEIFAHSRNATGFKRLPVPDFSRLFLILNDFRISMVAPGICAACFNALSAPENIPRFVDRLCRGYTRPAPAHATVRAAVFQAFDNRISVCHGGSRHPDRFAQVCSSFTPHPPD